MFILLQIHSLCYLAATWVLLLLFLNKYPWYSLIVMLQSTKWRSAKYKWSGMRNFSPVLTEQLSSPIKIYVGYYIFLHKTQNFDVCLSVWRLNVICNGAPTSAEQYSSISVRTAGRTLPKMFWEKEIFHLLKKINAFVTS